MMQAERRDRLLPPRNDNHRPSIHSKTAALLREQHASGSQTARPIAVDERSSADPARSRRTTAISREPAARCGGTHVRRHAPAMGEGQGPTPWLFSSTKRPIHEKKGGEATTTLFFSCWVGFLMTTHVVNERETDWRGNGEILAVPHPQSSCACPGACEFALCSPAAPAHLRGRAVGSRPLTRRWLWAYSLLRMRILCSSL